MATLFSSFFQASDSSGNPRAGALLYFYQSGTTTPITTYADAAEGTPSTTVVQSDSTSAIVADASGLFAPIFVPGSTAYKYVLKTSALVTVLTVDGVSPPITLSTTDQSVTGGARIVSLDLGTISSGTVTPDPGDRPVQSYTNGGAHTLAPGSNYGSYRLDITNNASAGAITVSGWTKVDGAFTTTNGDKFMCFCNVSELGSSLDIRNVTAAANAIVAGAPIVTLPHGTKSSGTFTPDPGDRPVQSYTNGGAHTLAPSSTYGSFILNITNNASAGAITTSGWTKVVGAFTTTNAHKFVCFCQVSELGSLLTIQAMQ